MNIQKKLLTVNFSTAKNQKIGICIHTMVGTLDGTDSHFRNVASEVSSHYGVDLDRDLIYHWVEEDHTAWAQGIVSGPTNKLVLEKGGNPNAYFISIECADGRNPAGADRSKQKKWLSELVADIAKRNGVPLDRDHVCGHKEIYNKKTCPGNINVDEIVELAKAINGEEILNLNADIPSSVEDKYDLKSKPWYNKYWTFAEYILSSIKAFSTVEKSEVTINDLKKEIVTKDGILEQNAKDFLAKNQQIESLQMTNQELTVQLGMLLPEKDKAVIALENAEVALKEFTEQNSTLTKEITEVLNPKIQRLQEQKFTIGESLNFLLNALLNWRWK